MYQAFFILHILNLYLQKIETTLQDDNNLLRIHKILLKQYYSKIMLKRSGS